jgi:hypothetical protein
MFGFSLAIDPQVPIHWTKSSINEQLSKFAAKFSRGFLAEAASQP